jgi:hypothetical protein
MSFADPTDLSSDSVPVFAAIEARPVGSRFAPERTITTSQTFCLQRASASQQLKRFVCSLLLYHSNPNILSAACFCITTTQSFCLQPVSASQQPKHFVCSLRLHRSNSNILSAACVCITATQTFCLQPAPA